LIKLIIDPTSCAKLIETLEDMLNPKKELSPANPIIQDSNSDNC
jgi:hypothetical protein